MAEPLDPQIKQRLNEVRFFDDGRPMFYGRQGEAISLGDWAEMFEDFQSRTIGSDQLDSGIKVVTVWLGIDDDVMGDEPPLIFGTAVLHEGHETREYMTATEELARAKHSEIVAGLKIPDPQ